MYMYNILIKTYLFMTKLGIIGISGRMGSLLASTITNHETYKLGKGYSRNNSYNLEEIFHENDWQK